MITTSLTGRSHSKKLNPKAEGKDIWPFWPRETKKESFSCKLQKNQRQGRLSMDYSTLPQPLTSIDEPQDLAEAMRHSLYETFQQLA